MGISKKDTSWKRNFGDMGCIFHGKRGGLYLGLCSNSFDSVDGDFTGCFLAADLKEIDISQYLSFKECCMIV